MDIFIDAPVIQQAVAWLAPVLGLVGSLAGTGISAATQAAEADKQRREARRKWAEEERMRRRELAQQAAAQNAQVEALIDASRPLDTGAGRGVGNQQAQFRAEALMGSRPQLGAEAFMGRPPYVRG